MSALSSWQLCLDDGGELKLALSKIPFGARLLLEFVENGDLAGSAIACPPNLAFDFCGLS